MRQRIFITIWLLAAVISLVTIGLILYPAVVSYADAGGWPTATPTHTLAPTLPLPPPPTETAIPQSVQEPIRTKVVATQPLPTIEPRVNSGNLLTVQKQPAQQQNPSLFSQLLPVLVILTAGVMIVVGVLLYRVLKR